MVLERTAPRRVLVAATVAAEACLRGAARFGRQHGWHLVADMAYTGAFPRGWKGDGILALVAYQHDMALHLLGAEAPCVAITIGDDALMFPRVRSDHAAAGRMAADHLLERGYRSFAWAPFITDQANRECGLGFETRLAEHGCLCQALPPAHRRIGGYWHDDWADHRRSLAEKLRRLPRPAAIFAANDCVAAGILDVCRELRIAVPGELAVLGAGNDATVCESAAVPLSSVELDVEEMAFRAAGVLDGLMQGRPAPDLTLVPPKRVVTRLSTDTCAVGNSQIAQALAYIAEHYPEPALSVADVAAAVGLSRRQLERSFRNETGCTVHEHIIKRRMEEASRLLRTHARAKVADIAGLVGLGGEATFFRTFRRFFGESPGEHRLAATRPAGPAPQPPPTRATA